MYKKILFIIIISLGMTSCDFLFKKQQKDILENEPITPIDFTSVDAYPLLPECKEMNSRKAQKACFYKILSKRIEVSLSKSTFQLIQPIKDTVFIKLQVSAKGILKISSINLSAENKEDKKNLEELISTSLLEVSPMQPAIKAGIPITTEFTLPIVLKPNS